ncbi:hypothetical protein GCM10027160_11310 [Streptomyces calidiresistens]
MGTVPSAPAVGADDGRDSGPGTVRVGLGDALIRVSVGRPCYARPPARVTPPGRSAQVPGRGPVSPGRDGRDAGVTHR